MATERWSRTRVYQKSETRIPRSTFATSAATDESAAGPSTSVATDSASAPLRRRWRASGP